MMNEHRKAYSTFQKRLKQNLMIRLTENCCNEIILVTGDFCFSLLFRSYLNQPSNVNLRGLVVLEAEREEEEEEEENTLNEPDTQLVQPWSRARSF